MSTNMQHMLNVVLDLALSADPALDDLAKLLVVVRKQKPRVTASLSQVPEKPATYTCFGVPLSA